MCMCVWMCVNYLYPPLYSCWLKNFSALVYLLMKRGLCSDFSANMSMRTVNVVVRLQVAVDAEAGDIAAAVRVIMSGQTMMRDHGNDVVDVRTPIADLDLGDLSVIAIEPYVYEAVATAVQASVRAVNDADFSYRSRPY